MAILNKPQRHAGVNGPVLDKLRSKAGDYRWPTAKDDPRLDRDYTRNALPVDVTRKNTWADVMGKRGK